MERLLISSFIDPAGMIYPKVNFLLSTSVSSLVASVSTMTIGHIQSIDLMLLAFALNGLSLGVIEGGSTVFVFQMWGTGAMPFIQAAYFMFGIGALAAPLLSEPFLILREPGDLMDGIEFGYSMAQSHQSHDSGTKFNLIIPYSILSGLMFCNAVIMLTVWWFNAETPEHPTRHSVKVTSGSVENGRSEGKMVVSKFWKVVVVALHLTLIHVYFGIDVGLASYLVTFVVMSDLRLTKTIGSHMTTMYWAAFTFTKLAAIVYIPWIGNRNSILLGLAVIMAGNAVLVPFAESSETMVWIGVALIGTGLSSIYACMLRYLEGFFPVTSTIGSLTSVAGVLGEFTFPALISLYIDQNPIVVIWVIAFSSCCIAILFPVIMLLCNMKLRI